MLVTERDIRVWIRQSAEEAMPEHDHADTVDGRVVSVEDQLRRLREIVQRCGLRLAAEPVELLAVVVDGIDNKSRREPGLLYLGVVEDLVDLLPRLEGCCDVWLFVSDLFPGVSEGAFAVGEVGEVDFYLGADGVLLAAVVEGCGDVADEDKVFFHPA